MEHSCRRKYIAVLGMLMLLLLPQILSAQDLNLAPVTRTYAIQNVIIKQAPGKTISNGTVVIKNGVISAVGINPTIPPNAQLIVADSMYLYAGFISGLSHTGVPKPKEDKKEKVKDPGNPPNDRAGVQPHRSILPMLDPKDKSINELRKIGFTSAHVVPHGGMLPGQGSLILLTGETADHMIYKNDVSLFSQLKGAQRMYPSTVIGVMAKYRDLYRKAQQSKDYEKRYTDDPSGLARPEKVAVEAAFYPVIDKKMPVVFTAEKVLDVQRALTLQRELGFSLMLAEVKQGWDLTEKIKSSGAKTFLSLDLPEIKEEKKDSSAVMTNTKKTAVELEEEALEKRKQEAIIKSYGQPATYAAQGIRFGFSTLEVKSSDVQKNVRKLLEYGMTEDDLLAALTTHPASLLGVADVMGTVEPGKIANVIISDKPYFEDKANVKYVFVDGVMYSYDVKKKKTSSSGDAIDVAGTWNYTAETPNGTLTGEIDIAGEPDAYEDTISNSFSGGTTDISSVSVEGSQMTLSYTISIGGNQISMELNVTVEEDTFEGTMTAGQFGSFKIEGQKNPENN